MFGICYHNFVKVCAETYPLVSPGTGRRHIYRRKRRVFDLDTAFFDGRFQPEITRLVTFQDGGEKFDHRQPVNWRAPIMPNSVPRDPHIDIAVELRIAGGAGDGILWMSTLKSV